MYGWICVRMYVHTVREEKTTEQSLTLNVFCTSLTHNYIRGLKAFSGGLLLGIQYMCQATYITQEKAFSSPLGYCYRWPDRNKKSCVQQDITYKK